jgi:hypothetical protein
MANPNNVVSSIIQLAQRVVSNLNLRQDFATFQLEWLVMDVLLDFHVVAGKYRNANLKE